MASPEQIDWAKLGWTTTGTFLAAASANTCTQARLMRILTDLTLNVAFFFSFVSVIRIVHITSQRGKKSVWSVVLQSMQRLVNG